MSLIKNFMDQLGKSKATKSFNSLADKHGQPVNRNISTKRLKDRKIDELIGLCKGITADNLVNQSEAEFLLQWLDNNREIYDTWPGNILYNRIDAMLSDKILDDNEKKELIDLLRQATGGPAAAKNINSMSTSLPLTAPAPKIIIENRIFCFTGKFITGTRNYCENIIIEKGGSIKKSPTLKTNYLVIGIIGSTDWIHSTHGRKIEAAVELVKQKKRIKIISEEHWAKFI